MNTLTASLLRGKNRPPTSVMNITRNYLLMWLQLLKLWGIRSTSSMPLLPGPLLSGTIALDKVLSSDQIEPFDI